MKHRKKGRRIYTYHARNRRVFSRNHPMRSALGAVVTMAVFAAIVFVGYNYIGPIVTRVHEEAEHPTTVPEPYFTDFQEVAETVPALETAVTAPVTSTTVLTTVTTTETTTTAVTFPARFGEGVTAAYVADESVLADLDTLDTAAKKAAEQGFTAMILPLKTDTGKLNYASELQKAKDCGATSGAALSAREIRNAVGRYQLECVAMISTLKDQTYPNTFMDGSYTFREGSTRWLDNKPSEGGKPWLSPFESAARDYLSEIAGELSDAGFARVICTDTVFPHFFHSDAELLGGRIEDAAQRKTALISVLNEMTAAAPNVCALADLQKLSAGEEEAFIPADLKCKQAVIRVDADAIRDPLSIGEHRYDPSSLYGTEKLLMLMRAAKDAAGDLDMIPLLVDHGMSDSDLEQTVAALHEDGISTVYFVKAAAQQSETTDETND